MLRVKTKNVVACNTADVFKRQKSNKTYCLSQVVVGTDVLWEDVLGGVAAEVHPLLSHQSSTM